MIVQAVALNNPLYETRVNTSNIAIYNLVVHTTESILCHVKRHLLKNISNVMSFCIFNICVQRSFSLEIKNIAVGTFLVFVAMYTLYYPMMNNLPNSYPSMLLYYPCWDLNLY